MDPTEAPSNLPQNWPLAGFYAAVAITIVFHAVAFTWAFNQFALR